MCGCKTKNTTCTSCCENTDPCITNTCGCEFEVDAACVRYTGEDLSCADVTKGDTLETALKAINEKFCNFSGTYITIVAEPAGDNCTNGGNLISVFDTESDTLLSVSYVCNGEQGEQGIQGDPGNDAVISDSGWVDLEGFDYYTGVAKPQCRRIGQQIHFRGLLIPPLSSTPDGLTLINLATTNSYINQPYPYIYTGASSGVTIDANGAIVFNNDSSVIPASIVATDVDGEYSLGRKIAYRNILLTGGIAGYPLTSVITVYMTSTKKLIISPLKDLEIVPTSIANAIGSSATRLITSNVRAGEYVPNYIASASNIHNSPSNANFPLVADTFNLTYPFTCDAGKAEHLGGFLVKLDGLSVFLP